MSNIKKILVPVTFSVFSKALIDYAVDIARPFNAEVIFTQLSDIQSIT